MTLNANIGDFMDFLTISGCDTNVYHSQDGATVLALVAWRSCNAFWLKRSYSTLDPVSTVMGDY